MLTKTGMWLEYIASCGIVFFLQLISKFFYSYSSLNPCEFPQTYERMLACWSEDKWLYLVLIGLIIFSKIWHLQWKRVKHNTRITVKPEKESTIEAVGPIVAYLAGAFTIHLDAHGIIVSFAILIALGVAIVQTGNIQLCLYFFLHGYHIYSSGNKKILTKKSLEHYLLCLDDSPDGIEARELTKNVYIVFEKQNGHNRF